MRKAQTYRNKNTPHLGAGIFITAAVVAAVFLAWQAAYHSLKPLPEGVNIESPVFDIPEDKIRFLGDITYRDANGERHIKQTVYDEVFKLIAAAKEYIVADMFLINSFQGAVPEKHRLLSVEFSETLAMKKKENPEIRTIVITDGINNLYGSLPSPQFQVMKEAGVGLIITDLNALRDSNILYSPLWRLFVKPFGEPSKPGGIIPNPIDGSNEGIGIRAALKLLNFKANHRKVIVADTPRGPAAVIMSGNAQDASSAHTNTGIRIEGPICGEIARSEMNVARFSGYKGPLAVVLEPGSPKGEVRAQYLTEGRIARKMEELIEMCGPGDSIDMIMFFLSDQRIINGMIRAAKRGASVRVVLDPNKDAFGRPQSGIPNTGAAKRLVNKSNGSVRVRWYDTGGEQCHAKMTLFRIGGKEFMINGSANMTRRNLRNFNLESVLFLESEGAGFMSDGRDFFDDIWKNRGMHCTVDYGVYRDENLLKYIYYRFQEAAGTGTF